MSSYITVDVSTVLPAKRKQAEKKDFISAVHIIPILQFDEVSSCLVETLVISRIPLSPRIRTLSGS